MVSISINFVDQTHFPFALETGTPEAEISTSTFPEDLKAYKDEIQSLRQEFQVTSRRLAEMMVEVPEVSHCLPSPRCKKVDREFFRCMKHSSES